MKALILGCGNIGSVAAEDLAESMPTTEVVVADKDEQRAETVAKKIGKTNISYTSVDVTEQQELNKTLKDFDIVLGFLPGPLGYRLMEACITAEKDLVDVSFMAENPLPLNAKASKAGVTIVPDCGLAPGISNMLVGHAISLLDRVHTTGIMVGGLPEKAIPPLDYTITWSPESLIDEYTRKARIVKNGRIIETEALSGLETIEFPNVGKLEAFYTDGLRTLMYTVNATDEMWEKTLRYPGHVEKIKLLKALGFFEDSPINIEGASISPRKVTAKLFGQKLWWPEVKDFVALKIEVSGIKDGKITRFVYHLLDYCDKKHGITAMARTTAYPASIVAQLLLKKNVSEKGVVPPEKLGMDEKLFQQFLDELSRHEIKINEEKTAS